MGHNLTLPGIYTFADLIESGVLFVSDGYRAKNEELGGDGPIFLRAGHVTDSFIDFEGVERFHSELTPRVLHKMSAAGDVIVTTKGNSTGRVAFVTKDMPSFVYSPHLSFWRSLKTEFLDQSYLRYWSRSSMFQGQLAGLAGSTDMAPYLSLVDQKRLKMYLPEPAEQHAIGGFLTALDDKVELNRCMNLTLETIARVLFKSWFGDFETAFDGVSWKASTDTLSYLADLDRSMVELADFPDEIFDHYSIPAFDDGKMAKREVGEDIKSNKFLVPPDSILLSKLNPRIPRVWLPSLSAEVRSICSTEFLVVVPREEIDREYLYSLFSSSEFIDEFASRATGTSGSHQRVRSEDLLRIEIDVPEWPARKAYSEIVRPMFIKVAQNLEESRTLAALRDTLLPKLLSGEIRVKQAEKIAEEVV